MTKQSTSATGSNKALSEFHQKLQDIYQKNRVKLPSGSNEILQQTTQNLADSDILPTSLKVGAYVADFELAAQWCNATSLHQLLETGPVVISFYRGLWCSYCRAEIEEYDKLMDQLVNANPQYPVHYIAVTGQQVFNQEVDHRRYHLIVDKQLAIARQFGLVYELPWAEQELFKKLGLSLPEVNKTDRWELPLAGVYVINQKRQVQMCHLSADYKDRADPQDIIKQFDIAGAGL
jgi:peroxiredoxin